jgi:hypothetical protein
MKMRIQSTRKFGYIKGSDERKIISFEHIYLKKYKENTNKYPNAP